MARLTEEAVRNVQFCVFSITIFLTVRVYSITHYCMNGNLERIQGETSGTIKTLEVGQSTYGNNMNCSWLLDAGLNNRVQLKTTLFDIQYTPNYISCYGNDNLQIYNGNRSSSPLLASICGTNNPFEVISQGRYLLLSWRTNDKNFYNRQGIHMDFQVFSNNACPPDWHHISSTKECIKLMLNPPKGADWSDSQQYCGYSQSNLAKYTSLKQFEFVQVNLSRPLTIRAWIGLNDVLEEGTYKWLDGSAPSTDIRSKFETYFSSTLRDCVIHHFVDENLMSKECSRENYHFLCLQRQDGTTTVYRAPESPPETTGFDKKKTSFTWAIILGVLAGCLGILLVIYLVFYLRKIMRVNEPATFESTNQEQAHNSSTNERGAEPSAPMIDREHPPTYEETVRHDRRYSKAAQAGIISGMVIICLLLGLVIYCYCRIRAKIRKESRAREQYIDVVQEEVEGIPIHEEGHRRGIDGPENRPNPQHVQALRCQGGGRQSNLPPTYSEALAHG